jgi:hypothetical protein
MSVFDLKRALNVFSVFTASAAALGVLALAACSYPSAPTGADELSLALQASAKPNADGTINVVVPLPAGGGGSDPVLSVSSSIARSLDSTFTQNNIDNYELLFRNIDTAASPRYYKAAAKAQKGYISIAVPPATYHVLLLGGNGDILLAAGYNGGTSNAGIEIKKGAINTVVITLHTVSPEWNIAHKDSTTFHNKIVTDGKNDFVFEATNLLNSAELEVDPAERAVIVSKATNADGAPYIQASSTFSFTFNISKLHPLIEASPTSASTNYDLQFVSQEAELATAPPDQDKIEGGPLNEFKKVTFTAAGFAGLKLTITEAQLNSSKTTPGTVILKYTNDTVTPLPQVSAEGALIFKLGYRAFSATASDTSHTGKTWTIQNGLNDFVDAPAPNAGDAASSTTADRNGNTAGGAIRVIFGTGSFEDTAGYVKIETGGGKG